MITSSNPGLDSAAVSAFIEDASSRSCAVDNCSSDSSWRLGSIRRAAAVSELMGGGSEGTRFYRTAKLLLLEAGNRRNRLLAGESPLLLLFGRTRTDILTNMNYM